MMLNASHLFIALPSLHTKHLCSSPHLPPPPFPPASLALALISSPSPLTISSPHFRTSLTSSSPSPLPGLPEGAGRTDLAMRIIEAQHKLGSDVKCMLVLSEDEGEDEREGLIQRLRQTGAIENVRVMTSRSPTEVRMPRNA